MGYTNWYTLRVLSGKENMVKEFLPYLEDYSKHVEDILIPNEKTVRVRGKKKFVVNKNLLPGYMFIQFKHNPDPDFIKSIEKTKFVASFLSDEKKRPLPLKDEEYSKIVGNIELSHKKVEELSEGDKIMVTDGPFQSFKGSVLEVDNERKKIKVIVKVFGRETKLDLTPNQVERTD